VLAAKWPICEFHVIWGFYMGVREGESFIVPGVVSVLVPGAEVDHPCLVFWLPQASFYQNIVSYTLEDDGDGLQQILFGAPPS